jgi:hypothetical protein
VDEHEAAGARPREGALDHPGDEAGRHTSVDGVSAGFEDPRARLRGRRVTGRYCAFHAVEVSARKAKF